MMMMDSVETQFPSSSNNKTCVHCCAPLRHPNVYNDDHNIQQSFSSFSSPNSGTKSLYSIFKLNYLMAFETLDWEEENDMEQLTLLCINCHNQLTNLYQLYEDFLQLGQIESSLNKKLRRLDEIIDCHAQKSISCDLIQVTRPVNHNNSLCANLTPSQSSSLLSSSQFTLRQPQLILSRLSEKDLKLKTTTTTTTTSRNDDDDDNYFPSPSNSADDDDEDDDDYNPTSPKVKMEVETLSDIEVKSLDNKMESESEDDDTALKTRKKKSSSSSSQKNRKVSGKPKGHRRKRKSMGWSTKSIMGSYSKKKQNNKNTTIKEKSTSKTYLIRGCKTNLKYILLKSKFPNPCWYCDRTDFDSPAECLEHTKKEHLPNVKEEDYCSPITLCDRCGKICPGGYYGRHFKKCMLIPSGVVMEKRYQCPVCPYRCHDTNTMNTHMVAHTTERTFACDLCDFTAKTNAVLRNHKKYVHEQRCQERVKCDECDRDFKNELVLKAHKLAMHTVEGHKSYRQRGAKMLAKYHEKKRLNTKPMIIFCEDCGVDLFNRLGFCNHRRTVHGDFMGGEHVCETCGMCFTRRDVFLVHTKTVHSDARPQVCDTCGKSFKRGDYLRCHIALCHTEEGRLKHNARMRAKNQRKKMIALKLANARMGPEEHVNV